jgi:hypothetical protein
LGWIQIKLTVMQPYFFPYLGYFRLLAVADTLVLLDNVQYQRRGWVHRNKFTKLNCTVDWFTLPVTKGDRDTTMIKDVKFKDGVDSYELIKPFQIFNRSSEVKRLWPNFFQFSGNLSEYLQETIVITANILGLESKILRASKIASKDELSGEEYIIKLCNELGADTYINAPSGKALYQQENFQREKIELLFLPEHAGSKANILERILSEEITHLRKEIFSNLELEQPL